MVSDELPGAEPGKDDLDALKQQLEEEQKKSAENLSGWQRAAADFANYRKRTEQEKNDLLRFGNAGLILKILPVVDDFERAVATLPQHSKGEHAWLDGIMLIQQKLHAVLEAEGLRPIDALGKPFDPSRHEAVLQEDVTDPGDDGKVLAELQKGYALNDRIIRPAMVKVGKKGA